MTPVLFKALCIHDMDWWQSQVTRTSSVSTEGLTTCRATATAMCFKFSLANYLEEKQGWKWNSALSFTDKTNLSWFLWAGTRFFQTISQQTLRSSWSFHMECLSCHTTVIFIKFPCAHSSVDSIRLLPVLAGHSTAKSWKAAFPTANHPTLNARKIRGGKKKKITATFSAKRSKILNSRAR